jgi:hypothetical protein
MNKAADSFFLFENNDIPWPDPITKIFEYFSLLYSNKRDLIADAIEAFLKKK